MDFKANQKNPNKEIKNPSVKYTSEIIENIKRGNLLEYDESNFRISEFRAFVKKYTYYDKIITHRLYQQDKIFPLRKTQENKLICVNIGGKPFNVLAVSILPDYHLNGDCNCLPLYTYDSKGNLRENITDWALEKFREHYREIERRNKSAKYVLDGLSADGISKIDIFQYVYAVLHNPAYRKKYELNLKRDFPRIPFYDDFNKWKQMGGALLDLHLKYEQAEKFPLERKDISGENPKPKLKADKENGAIYIDSQTTLAGVPPIAWEYKLGNRSALEWILDQYKEKKPKDKTIAEKFDNYRFADYKEQVIELLQQVCAVSVKTMEIIGKMEEEEISGLWADRKESAEEIAKDLRRKSNDRQSK